jgi:hypothetical protein
MAENRAIVVPLSHVRLLLEWFDKDGYLAAPQLTTEGRLAACDLLYCPTGFETLMKQIRDSVPNTAHHLEEIWAKLSLGDVVKVNDNTKSEISDVMRWLSGPDSSVKSVFLTFNIHSPQTHLELGVAACNQMV